eukprot:m.220922 g.220922  ORF g.220922 m.220922 type:complete len:51 (+) comp15120_c0_seq3:2001-2153(+)
MLAAMCTYVRSWSLAREERHAIWQEIDCAGQVAVVDVPQLPHVVAFLAPK